MSWISRRNCPFRLVFIPKHSGFDAEHGNYIIIAHDHGIQTIYRHLQKSLASNGDSVAAGDTIGTVGQTGMATGAHLAFSVYVDGTAVNPLEYFD